jgi:ADP-ribosylation factor-like protein 2
LDNAGKTTIVKRLMREPIDTISPTLGFKINTVDYNDYKLNIWDVGGQKSLRTYWRNYFESTDGLIWVIDCADRVRLEDCKEEMHKLLQEDRLEGATLLIFANKQDLPGAMPLKEVGILLELGKIQTHHWKMFKASALSDENILEGINWIVSDISKRIYYNN